MRFVEEPGAAAPAEPTGFLGLPALPPALLARLAESGLLALVALVGILAVGRPVANRLSAALMPPAMAAALPGGAAPAGVAPMGATLPSSTTPATAAATAAQYAALGAAPGAASAAAGEDAAPVLGQSDVLVALPNVQGQMRASSLNAVAELVEKHPGEALAVLRRWLTPQGAAGGVS